MEVELPDGTIVEDVPEGMTKVQLYARLKKSGYDIKPLLEAENRNPANRSDPTKGDATLQLGPLDTGIPIPQDMNNFMSGAGRGVYNWGRGAGQMLGMVSDEDINESRHYDAPLMKTSAGNAGEVVGNIGGGVVASFVPGANSLLGAGIIGSSMGALQPTVGDESRAENTVKGGVSSLAGFGAGKLLGKAKSYAAEKIFGIESKVAAKAAEQAAAETASARSAAGNAAQNAYRQLEHLRELKAMRGLTPEETQIAKELSEELAQKAQEKLIPAAALKKSTAQAYADAIANESKRASEMAADKLGSSEVKRQVMARLMRYGPAAAGGVVGNMIFPGLGGSVGGAATGLVLRPAIRSMMNLSKNPAVQRAVLSPVANSKFLSNPQLPRALSTTAPAVALASLLRSLPPDQEESF